MAQNKKQAPSMSHREIAGPPFLSLCLSVTVSVSVSVSVSLSVFLSASASLVLSDSFSPSNIYRVREGNVDAVVRIVLHHKVV